MAEIWRAEAAFDNGERHTVAIKRVLPHMGDEIFRSMFMDEARLGMLLRHPNIVRVYDARSVGGTYIMVMEYVDGDSLKGLLEHAHQRRACMPVPTALYIIKQLALALDYAHTAESRGRHLGIVHRDVSPHNLLLGRNGDIKLADFGLADATVHETVRSADLVGGKLGYLAPEVIHQKKTDHRIDIFAAGIMLWEMLAGRRLFQGKTDVQTIQLVAKAEIPSLRELNDRVPAVVEEGVMRILAANAEDRIPSARKLVELLVDLLDATDPNVGPKDVALLLGLHLAKEPRRSIAVEKDELINVAALLQDELNSFAQEGPAMGPWDVGAKPLDPLDFTTETRNVGISGVRPFPSDDVEAWDPFGSDSGDEPDPFDPF